MNIFICKNHINNNLFVVTLYFDSWIWCLYSKMILSILEYAQCSSIPCLNPSWISSERISCSNTNASSHANGFISNMRQEKNILFESNINVYDDNFMIKTPNNSVKNSYHVSCFYAFYVVLYQYNSMFLTILS